MTSVPQDPNLPTNEPTTVYLLRHAESRPDPAVREPDWPLSERGHQQALDIVPALTSLGIDQVYSSPYRRAVETVRPFAERAGKPLGFHADLRERRSMFVAGESDFIAQVRRTWEDLQFTPPGGESGAACQQRVVRAITDIVGRHPRATLLVSSHGIAISLMLNRIDRSFDFDGWAAMKNPDLFKIEASGTSFAWDRSWQILL